MSQSSNALPVDLEIQAMSQVSQALAPLDKVVQIRVLNWVSERFGLALAANAKGESSLPVDEQQKEKEPKSNSRASREGTVSSVAIKLGADSCRTLMQAAAAHLTFFEGIDAFSREQLVNRTKEARNWKSDYTGQTSTQISRLLSSGFLFEKSKDVFSVSTEALTDLEQKLA